MGYRWCPTVATEIQAGFALQCSIYLKNCLLLLPSSILWDCFPGVSHYLVANQLLISVDTVGKACEFTTRRAVDLRLAGRPPGL